MYRYDEFDQALVAQRVEQFRGQVARRLDGTLSEDEFRPLRLMNGLYLQLHAYMLRVAVPYGTLSAAQMRMLAHIARRYDRGYGHFTTRQNIQYNWLNLGEVPDLLADLASVEMHAIQTSGNCIRNTTTDHLAGAAADEMADPRVYAEIIRQWSTLHPEFSFLPRKFKIAVTGAPNDRAATAVHDIGLKLRRDDSGALGFAVIVGGGQGRTPIIGEEIRAFLPEADLLSYLEAILRVYNQLGRRDNLYKARIKILVQSTGPEKFAEMVEEEWRAIRDGALTLPAGEVARIRRYFETPDVQLDDAGGAALAKAKAADPAFAAWCERNTRPHRVGGLAIALISLKKPGGLAPGDATADQMDAVADIATAYGHDEIRVSHDQNLALPYVKQGDLYAVWQALVAADLATSNIGLASDIIACPGLDFCNLANARSIPVAQQIMERLGGEARAREIGDLQIKISGCINACGHHHVGHIGILGVDKKGAEFYQVTLGGSAAEDAALGDILGPAFPADEIAGAVEEVVNTYTGLRQGEETFLETYRRAGLAPFKEAVYGAN
jgi:sulfite reductase (NADPH) hemoprotein beta-component